MTANELMRLRGPRKNADLLSRLTKSTMKSTKDADSEDDLDDDAEDKTALTANEKQVLVSPLPHVFGRAVYNKAHYIKDIHSRTAYAIKILGVQSMAFLMDQTMVNFSPELVWLASFFGRPTSDKDGRAENRPTGYFQAVRDLAAPLAGRYVYHSSPESLCLSKGSGSSEICAMVSEAVDHAPGVAEQDAANVAGGVADGEAEEDGVAEY